MSRRFRENPKSEMDSQRDLLDTLMGVNRNMDRAEDEINDYHDDRVCKFYLSGVCSHGTPHHKYFSMITFVSHSNVLAQTITMSRTKVQYPFFIQNKYLDIIRNVRQHEDGRWAL